MDEQQARALLSDWISSVNGLRDLTGNNFIAWPYHGRELICLDGEFTIDQLEAMVWWMRNKA